MSAIGPGDLVRQVGYCCERTKRCVGFIYLVKAVIENAEAFCGSCSHETKGPVVIVPDPTCDGGGDAGAPRSWFVKIEPPPVAAVTTEKRAAVPA